MADLLVYGAYGYTGELIARAAVDRDLTPVLAGRDATELTRLADELDCDRRAFGLDDPDAVTDALADVDVVLNCAGPFAHTYEPLLDAALETGTHYLDITGEIDVFRGIADRDEEARDADVLAMPGVGFDVVPTDCLAAHLADRLPEATHLALGFDGLETMSPGTAKTMLEYAGGEGLVRRNGRIEPVPAASDTRRIDFGRGKRSATAIPWGDVVTGYHTTGIPNIQVYMALPTPAIWGMRSTRWLGPLLSADPVKATLQRLVDATVSGPSADERAQGRTYVWGEARTDDGEAVESRLETPETYALTVETALAIATRVLDGDAPVGFQTPAGAYGADLIMEIEGVERVDVR